MASRRRVLAADSISDQPKSVIIVLYPVSKLSSLLSFVILRLAGVKNLNVTKVYTLGKMDLNDFIQQSIDEASDKSDMDTEVKIRRYVCVIA